MARDYTDLWAAATTAANEAIDALPLEDMTGSPESELGGAMIRLVPGTHPFARWARKNGHADKAPGGGVYLNYPSPQTQIAERHKTVGDAFAARLRADPDMADAQIYVRPYDA